MMTIGGRAVTVMVTATMAVSPCLSSAVTVTL